MSVLGHIGRTTTVTYTLNSERLEATVEIGVDLDAIARQLGPRAAYNKSHKSRAMAGAIIVLARSVRAAP